MGRRWADNTYASTCNEYKNPPDGYAYSGATGSGVYQIDPGADGTPESVYCDMVFDGGGWTLVFHSTYTGNNQADPGIDVNMATRRTVTIGSPDSYTGVGTAGFYFLAMNDFKGVGDDSTALRFESDNFQDHTTLQDLSVTATYGLDGSNESQIRTEMCGGNNNCFIDAPGLSTTDVRQDNHSQFCLPSYYDQAWWYDNCFSYNPTWTSGMNHFAGYSSKDSTSQHWSWWMR